MPVLKFQHVHSFSSEDPVSVMYCQLEYSIAFVCMSTIVHV